ncbi:sulfate transport system ATP-binding protein [Burkholderiales bacterium]|nr:MAG: ABC transporter ATP-binding protein [Burkholderiales bacterium]CAG0961032.1 sulfate transport system ATP-binding protein [Burkholderiales bacterium]
MLAVELRQHSPIPLDLAFSCPPGQTLALVGPSGSGKTTVLKTIAGLYRGAQGRVRVGAETWLDTASGRNLPARERAAGLVFQSYALFPHLSVLDNVLEAARGASPAEKRARALEKIASVHLAGLEHRRPQQLSGGQQQRVALARALAREPAVLLLDEPFSAVDQVTRERLYEELAGMRKELSIPVVLVTHSISEAQMLADRMVVLHHGCSLQEGSPREVLSHPATLEVARLLGQKNLFRATVEAQDAAAGHTLLRWGAALLRAPYREQLTAGQDVAWMMASGMIIMQRPDRSPARDNENPVTGRIGRLTELGEITLVQLLCAGVDAPLSFPIATHAAQRYGLRPGETMAVSLLSEGLHLFDT